MNIENRMQLQRWREECQEKRRKETCKVLICGGTGCLAGGSDKIYARIKELTQNMDGVSENERMSWILRDGTSGSN